jgi:hypothetical protein
MPFQIDSPAAKAYSFRLQSKFLFDSMIAPKFDLSSRT